MCGFFTKRHSRAWTRHSSMSKPLGRLKCLQFAPGTRLLYGCGCRRGSSVWARGSSESSGCFRHLWRLHVLSSARYPWLIQRRLALGRKRLPTSAEICVAAMMTIYAMTRRKQKKSTVLAKTTACPRLQHDMAGCTDPHASRVFGNPAWTETEGGFRLRSS